MCGIAGHLLRRGAASTEVTRQQLETILHRGPDSLGVHTAGPCSIGQTRLSVIDLVTGDPPITVADASIGVAFN